MLHLPLKIYAFLLVFRRVGYIKQSMKPNNNNNKHNTRYKYIFSMKVDFHIFMPHLFCVAIKVYSTNSVQFKANYSKIDIKEIYEKPLTGIYLSRKVSM